MTNETGRSQSGLYGTGGIVTGPRVGFWLYLVTDGAPDPRAALVSPLESRLSTALAAVPQGTVAVQLRAKSLDGGALFAAAERLRQLTRRFGAPFFVNDRVDVALAVGVMHVLFKEGYADWDYLRKYTDAPDELAALLDPRAYKVNLIPYNPTGSYDGSSPERILPSTFIRKMMILPPRGPSST